MAEIERNATKLTNFNHTKQIPKYLHYEHNN